MSGKLGRRAFMRAGAGAVAAAAASASVTAQETVDYGGWFENVSNYDGTTEDMTGQSQVTIEVGAQGNGGAFAFSPPAVRVDPGTTVQWEWTGNGGTHNVVEASESGGHYESELMSEAGSTFTLTFESEGISKYYCSPHRSLGMKGAVVVGSTEGDTAVSGAESVPGGATQGTPSGNGEGDGNGDGGGNGEGDGNAEETPSGPTFDTETLSLFLVAAVIAALSPLFFLLFMAKQYRPDEE
ncbi:halocyanin domain-containing protein [Natronomonas sp. EA1]|uniref:halocyanin domain-containing protein n=1 Tax=Natronomonas sp. EA1 TaxID=3421655 RepID=UPI003EB6E543